MPAGWDKYKAAGKASGGEKPPGGGKPTGVKRRREKPHGKSDGWDKNKIHVVEIKAA